MNVDLKVDEGRKYYFGNITWKGNSKYSDSVLNVLLGIKKEIFIILNILNKRLGKEYHRKAAISAACIWMMVIFSSGLNRLKQLFIMIPLIMK